MEEDGVMNRRAMFRIHMEGRSPKRADGLNEGCELKCGAEGASL